MSTAGPRPQSGSRAFRPDIRLSALGILAFLCGAFQPATLNFVGEIYATELLLPLLAIAAMFTRSGGGVFRQRLFWMLLLAISLSLAGYVLSDVMRDTRPDQYLRGWGRVLLLASDFIALAVLSGQDRRNLWWFALGMGVGGIFYLRILANTPIAVWKFGYAEPMMLVAVTLGFFLPLRLAAGWLGLLGLASMWYDFRSFAGICFILFAYAWTWTGRSLRQPNGTRSVRLVLAAGAAACMVLVTLSFTESDYSSKRRAQSDAGRTAALEVGLIGIMRSPLVGYGSWAENRELAQLYLERASEKQGSRDPNQNAGKFFSPHSQILHAWIEGGLLGAAFFILLGIRLLRSLKWIALERPFDLLTFLVAYTFISCAWNLLMSPFSAPHRIQIALGAAVLMLMDSEWRASRSAESRAAIARNRNPGVRSVPSALHKTAR